MILGKGRVGLQGMQVAASINPIGRADTSFAQLVSFWVRMQGTKGGGAFFAKRIMLNSTDTVLNNLVYVAEVSLPEMLKAYCYKQSPAKDCQCYRSICYNVVSRLRLRVPQSYLGKMRREKQVSMLLLGIRS